MAGPNYPAPIVAIECMQKAAGMTRDDALQVEAEGFIKVANTPVATSVIGYFHERSIDREEGQRMGKTR